mgnify:CR=1 FL=1
MKSFQTIYERLQTVTGDDSDAMLAIFKEDINETQRIVLSAYKWPFLERTKDITTLASTARYELPADCGTILTLSLIHI